MGFEPIEFSSLYQRRVKVIHRDAHIHEVNQVELQSITNKILTLALDNGGA